MTQLRFRVEGTRRVQRGLQQLADELSNPRKARTALGTPLRRLMRSTVERDIRNNTPVDTGRLVETVRTNAGQPRRDEVESGTLSRDTVIVARSGWFWRGVSFWRQALAVEFGSRTTAPSATLRNALQSNITRLLSGLSSALSTALERRAERFRRTGR